jgi:hypothetical protein
MVHRPMGFRFELQERDGVRVMAECKDQEASLQYRREGDRLHLTPSAGNSDDSRDVIAGEWRRPR